MIPSIITALQNLQAPAIPGICKLYAIAKDEVAAMPDTLLLLQSIDINAATIKLSDIVPISGGSLNAISNDNHAGTEILEDQKATANGSFFTYEISFQLPNDNEALRGQILRAFDNREWIVVAKQSNGSWRVFGNLNRGCDFKSILTSGSQIRGTSGNKCGFYWETNERALYMAEPTIEILTVTNIVTGIGIYGVSYSGSNFTGTLTVLVQIYLRNEWVTIDTPSIAPGIAYTSSVSSDLPAGTYYARILSSSGISSNVFTHVVV